jgi:Tol biopolymer transport system component
MIKLFNQSIGLRNPTKTESLIHAAVLGCGLLSLVVTPAPSAYAQKYSDWSAPVNLGPVINSVDRDIQPAISKNGLSLYFTSNRPGGFGFFDIYVSQRARVTDPWGAPVNLGPTINSADDEGAPVFSRDGHFMFFQGNYPGGLGDVDIWVSWRQHTHDDFGWQPPLALGAGVNSAALDAGPSYFENDEGGAPQLYFGSTRLGTVDIYLSELMADGSFGPAQLVPELNSPMTESRPSIRHDGLEIFFYSDRVGSIDGSDDLWTSTRESTLAPWSTPVNLGAINTTSLERFPHLSPDGTTLFFASNRPGGFGGQDLYMSTRTKLRGRSNK